MKIPLNEYEESLIKNIDFDITNKNNIKKSGENILKLIPLIKSKIPKIRWDYFSEPEHCIGCRKKSRIQILEENGNKSIEDIFTHPHFFRYLKYFIYGPDLPEDVIKEFRSCAEYRFHGNDFEAYCKKTRELVRKFNLKLDFLGGKDVFYQLALEFEETRIYAKEIRDCANQTSRRLK